MGALRSRFGSSNLVTAAITADGTDGGKIDAADYGGAAQYVDWYNVMTYDYFGAFDADGPDRPALAADVLRRHPDRGLPLRRGDPEAQEQGHPVVEAVAGHRFLRPRLDRRHAERTGRLGDRRRAGHLRAGHRGLQGAQDPLPGDRHGRRHRLRLLRQPVVELRHPGHHRRQDGLRQPAGPRRRVLLGAVRRHVQR